MSSHTTINEVISNIEKTSLALEKMANCPSNYNMEGSDFLAKVSQQMYKYASSLKEHDYLFGGLYEYR